jgi:putative acetyltransferase
MPDPANAWPSVRLLRDDELPAYLSIVNAAITGLAAGSYSEATLRSWRAPITEAMLDELRRNDEHEIRLIAELDGDAVGIGALVVEGAELHACYVLPTAARRGVGSALVDAIERQARAHGLDRLMVVASLNAEPFYAALGYRVRERGEILLRDGQPMAAVWMSKLL